MEPSGSLHIVAFLTLAVYDVMLYNALIVCMLLHIYCVLCSYPDHPGGLCRSVNGSNGGYSGKLGYTEK